MTATTMFSHALGVRPLVRPFAAAEWPLYRSLRLRSLADAPHAFGSTLAQEEARSDDDWAWRLNLASGSHRDRPLVVELDGTPAGLAWAKFDTAEPGVVNLFQMWVAPEARGHGAAAALLDAALAWARACDARVMQLGVIDGNAPARRLYERAGFEPFGTSHPMRPGDARLEQLMRVKLA